MIGLLAFLFVVGACLWLLAICTLGVRAMDASSWLRSSAWLFAAIVMFAASVGLVVEYSSSDFHISPAPACEPVEGR